MAWSLCDGPSIASAAINNTGRTHPTHTHFKSFPTHTHTLTHAPSLIEDESQVVISLSPSYFFLPFHINNIFSPPTSIDPDDERMK